MNKSEFIRAYADKLGITIKEADANFNAFVDTITDSLKKGEYIHISGFATFEIKDKAERIASGSTFLEISGKLLGNISFLFPRKTEQDKVGSFFEGLDNLITLHQREQNN